MYNNRNRVRRGGHVVKSHDRGDGTSNQYIIKAKVLFGNEAGEDESQKALESYFVDKPAFADCYDDDYPFVIVKAKKGMGKSALLRKAFFTAVKEHPHDISIYAKGADLVSLVPRINSNNVNEWINLWQRRICTFINRTIGRDLGGFVYSDVDISLVEDAELNGIRDRNLVSVLADRLHFKLEHQKIPIKDHVSVLEKYQKSSAYCIRIYIDDIDLEYLNTPENRVEISSFFTACRYLCNSTNGLKIRTTVRTDVWTLLDSKSESLDKAGQYLIDIKWSNRESEEILVRKILGFISRRGFVEKQQLNYPEDKDRILRLVFENPVRWGTRETSVDRPIHTLSAGRPRWSSHLCKLAASAAISYQANRISIKHISTCLKDYGKYRLGDLYKEHGHQCDRLTSLVESFSNGVSKYTTDQLFGHITENALRKFGNFKIDGMDLTNGSMSVARFLYRIGFINGRKPGDNGGLGFVLFEDRPDLLTTSQNLDDNLTWEIHPSYREILNINKR